MKGPADLGLPEKFAKWRGGQEDAFWGASKSEKRWLALALPTGVGKSSAYMAIAVANSYRTLVLTATRGLQDQLQGDFGSIGLVDVRGMTNYRCIEDETAANCGEGPCLVGYLCKQHHEKHEDFEEERCLYHLAVEAASKAELVVTNYPFYFHNAHKLGAFDLVVMDEAHEVPELLAAHVAIRIGDWVVDAARAEWPDPDSTLKQWRQWATETATALEYQTTQESRFMSIKVQIRVREAMEKLGRLAAVPDGWLVAREKTGWAFQPVWPTAFAKEYLWHSTPHIILSSATLNPKTVEDMLGVKKDDYDWIESPSPFPIANRRVHVMPVGPGGSFLGVKYNMSEDDMYWWVKAIDRVIAKRIGQKGIVHTVSYKRAEFLKAKSAHRRHMLIHTSNSTRDVVKAFKEANAPAILVSPSVTTGYDFPFDFARWQVIAKVPFPDATGPVMKARSKLDPDYPMFVAMTTLVQMAGRIVRAENDHGSTYICDDQARWFLPKFKRFAPRWFMEAVTWGDR